MNTIETLQSYANKHWATDKTKKTSCTYKVNGTNVTEARLWIWLLGNEKPMLVTNFSLTGSDKEDFARLV